MSETDTQGPSDEIVAVAYVAFRDADEGLTDFQRMSLALKAIGVAS